MPATTRSRKKAAATRAVIVTGTIRISANIATRPLITTRGFGDRSLYQRYFRQGFENGYEDAYRGY
jgi:hypothetical protein